MFVCKWAGNSIEEGPQGHKLILQNTKSSQMLIEAHLRCSFALPCVGEQVFQLCIAVFLGGGLGHGLEAGPGWRGGLSFCNSSMLLCHSNSLCTWSGGGKVSIKTGAIKYCSRCFSSCKTLWFCLAFCKPLEYPSYLTQAFCRLAKPFPCDSPTVHAFDFGLAGLWVMLEGQDLVIFFMKFDKMEQKRETSHRFGIQQSC